MPHALIHTISHLCHLSAAEHPCPHLHPRLCMPTHSHAFPCMPAPFSMSCLDPCHIPCALAQAHACLCPHLCHACALIHHMPPPHLHPWLRMPPHTHKCPCMPPPLSITRLAMGPV